MAHEAQLHPVPDALSDDDAVMVEPTACAVHAALAAGVEPDDTVAVLGGGHPGAVHRGRAAPLAAPGALLVGAKYAHQRRLAEELGADVVVDPDQLARAVRRRSRSLEASGTLTGGADVVIDCVGSDESLAQALGHGAAPGAGRPRGHARSGHRRPGVAVAPGGGGRRRLRVRDRGRRAGSLRRTFDIAMEVVAAKRPRPAGLGPLPARPLRGGARPRRRGRAPRAR